jgi:glycosyltransferase involved in cell wall biosynthesis
MAGAVVELVIVGLFLDVLFWSAMVFLSVQLLTAASNLVFFPVVPSRPYAVTERVSILIPARDEAENLRETLPTVLKQPAFEVIVLDDESSDDTPAILEAFRSTDERLRVLTGKPLPAGWVGKNWACHQLAAVAEGDYLLFTDADVSWNEGALASLLAFRRFHRAAFLSVWPRQVTVTLVERLVIPVIDMILLGTLPYLAVRYLPWRSFAAGNGQMMLWSREAYQVSGGHESVKQEVLEDVRMGQRAKAKGIALALALGQSALKTRMYASKEALVEGFGKSLLSAVGRNRLVLIGLVFLNTLCYLLAYVFALLETRWLVIVVGGLLLRVMTSAKTGRVLLEAIYQPLFPLVLIQIMWRALRSEGYTWKGRNYR